MTCIVGCEHDGRVYLGGDSAGSDGWTMGRYRAPKVFRNGPFVIGYTTSFRMGQLLEHGLSMPEQRPSEPDDKFMATTFVDAVRSCLKTGGFAKVENGVDHGGVFLVGYRGRLYRVEEDYQVGSPTEGYGAVGSGAQVALGALYVAAPRFGPEERLTIALEAAEAFCAGVRGPFTIVASEAA